MAEPHPKRAFDRIVELLKSGARDEAEGLCRDAVERDPGDINFVALLGSILADGNQLEEAAELLGRAVRTAPGHAQAREDLGTILLNLNRPGEALEHLERAADLRAPRAPLLHKLGGAYQRLGRTAEAEAALKQAAALSPFQAKLEEATRLFVTGRFRESEKLAQALVRENPEDVNAALLLARIAAS